MRIADSLMVAESFASTGSWLARATFEGLRIRTVTELFLKTVGDSQEFFKRFRSQLRFRRNRDSI